MADEFDINLLMRYESIDAALSMLAHLLQVDGW
jgi:hypothetical protein